MAKVRETYLVFTPGFGTRFSGSLVVFSALAYAAWVYKRNEIMRWYDMAHIELLMASQDVESSFPNLAGWFSLGLLSSACCVIQIILNFFSMGCAGFNTYLGPLRPYFLAITVLAQCWAWSIAVRQPKNLTIVAGSTALVALLSFLPEVLYLLQRRTQLKQAPMAASAKSVAVLQVEGLGCISCATKVQAILDAAPDVLANKVSVEQGEATVYFSSVEEKESATIQDIQAKCSVAGFPATVKSIGAPTDMVDPSGAALEGQSATGKVASLAENGDLGQACTVKLHVEGMMCTKSCTPKVEKVLRAVAGVKSVEVSLEGKSATVVGTADADALIAAVNATGKVASLGSCEALNSPSLGERAVGLTDGWVSAVLAGLMSSSCCLLQLGLNLLSALDVFHVGCAGFNKTLGPIRWPLRATALTWLAMLWGAQLRSKAKSPSSSRMLLLRSLLTLGLMFLPELLLWAGAPAVAPPTGDMDRYEIKLNGMGCEACQMHVQKVLEATSGVVGATVDFKTGQASVLVAKDWGFDLNATGDILADDGYEILESVRASEFEEPRASSNSNARRPGQADL